MSRTNRLRRYCADSTFRASVMQPPDSRSKMNAVHRRASRIMACLAFPKAIEAGQDRVAKPVVPIVLGGIGPDLPEQRHFGSE